MIYAVSTTKPPPALAEDVGKIRQELKVNLSVLKEEYHKPADEPRFKKQLEMDERKIADLLLSLQEALEDLKSAGDDAATGRAKETKRWQVNYDFTLARLEAQIAYLFEYQSMLGQMRKQLPDLGPGQTGWRLASQVALKGDTQGKKLAKDSNKPFWMRSSRTIPERRGKSSPSTREIDGAGPGMAGAQRANSFAPHLLCATSSTTKRTPTSYPPSSQGMMRTTDAGRLARRPELQPGRRMLTC